jgi:hypothetical protein
MVLENLSGVGNFTDVENLDAILTDPLVLGIVLFFMMLIFALFIGMYIYVSLAHVAIAKKAKNKTPGLAWIPLVGPLLISFQIAKMHWWPFLLFPLPFLFIGFPILSSILTIPFGIFSTIWEFKMFKAVKKPGWWAIFTSGLSLIAMIPSYFYAFGEVPLSFSLLYLINFIFYFIFIGIAAWSKK